MAEEAYDDCEISLGYYRGPLDAVLAGLEQAELDGAVLELDGSGSQLHAFVDARTRAHSELAEKNQHEREIVFQLGPVSIGRGGRSYLPIEGDNLAELRALADRCAEPEIAVELAVHDADGGLVWAPDVGDNEIWVSPRLSERSLEALRSALGQNLQPE